MLFFALVYNKEPPISDDTDICDIMNNQTNCLLCLEVEDCGYCRSENRCYNVSSTPYRDCAEKLNKRDTKCVRELEYDAKPFVRYFLGGTVVVVGIAFDILARVCFRMKSSDDYSKL